MLLSIIVPVRNEISYIANSFRSIIKAASRLESEIFFVDGKSSDGTFEWLQNGIKTLDNCKLIINNDFEIAKKFNFDGIHLGQNDKSCMEAKAKFGKGFIVGVSCTDSLSQYKIAENQKADYVAFGPMYKTFSKRKKKN